MALERELEEEAAGGRDEADCTKGGRFVTETYIGR